MLLHYIESVQERKKDYAGLSCGCNIWSNGHMGKTRTVFKIEEQFMWHRMKEDVIDLVTMHVLGFE